MNYDFFKKIKNRVRAFFYFLETFPSRLFFANGMKLKYNLIPFFEINYYLNIFKKKNKTELDTIGYKKIDYFLDKNIIQSISNKFEKFIEDSSHSKFAPGKKKKFVLNPLELIPEIKQLNNLIYDDLYKYYLCNYKIDRVRAWRIYPDDSYYEKRQKYIYSNYWHFDQDRSDQVNVFILLSDRVNKETGSTKLLDYESTKEAMRNFTFVDVSFSNEKIDEMYSKKKKIYYCSGNKGDTFIVNTHKCLHSASIPKKGFYRDIIQFEVYKDYKSQNPYFSSKIDEEVNNF